MEKLQDVNEKYSNANKSIHELQDVIINKDVEITQLKERIQELIAKIKDLESMIQALNMNDEEKNDLIRSLK